MGINGDDACLGMEVVHSKHSINVTYGTNTITIQTIQVPVLWGVSLSLASFLRLWTLSSFSCTPKYRPQSLPRQVHRGFILQIRVPLPTPGGPCQ